MTDFQNKLREGKITVKLQYCYHKNNALFEVFFCLGFLKIVYKKFNCLFLKFAQLYFTVTFNQNITHRT